MGYIFDFKDSLDYDKWLFGPHNRFMIHHEQKLMMELVSPLRGTTLLDIGCGNGARMLPFIETGVDVTGIDPSPYMIDMGREKLKKKMTFYRGFGESLPFEDNEFHYATIVTSLEFVQDPRKVIQEAARVTKNKIFIGIYNRYALNSVKLKIKSMFSDTIYRQAQFFSIGQLKYMVKEILGDVPIDCKTLCRMPKSLRTTFDQVKISGVIQKWPWGAFAGILIRPVPRFRTTPLILKYNTEKSMPSRVQPIKGSQSG